MVLKGSSFNFIVFINLFFCFSVSGFAQTNQAVLIPIINLVLDEPEFSCEFSIVPLSPSVGSTIDNGDRVTAQINYRLNNVPNEFEVSFWPVLFAEPDDDGNQSGLILNSTESLIIKDFGSNDANLSGQIEVGRTVNVSNDTLFENLELSVIYRRITTEEDLPFFDIGTTVTTSTNVSSCNARATSAFNFLLSISPVISRPRN